MPHTIPQIHERLAGQGFVVSKVFHLTDCSPTLDSLAMLMGFQHRVFEPLLRHMRGNIREHPGFYVELGGMSRNDVAAVKSLCHLLRANGLLEDWSVQRGESRIGGRVADSPAAFDFLTGGWLEHCCRIFIQQFLNLDTEIIEIGQNVQVTRPDGRTFEMDILLWIAGDLHWWEAKAGRHEQEQLARYRAVREELGLDATHCTLVLPQAGPMGRLDHFGLQTGFTVITPDRIGERVEEIEERYR